MFRLEKRLLRDWKMSLYGIENVGRRIENLDYNADYKTDMVRISKNIFRFGLN